MTTCGALITPPGAAAIAVIQIVGPESINVWRRIFRAHRAEPTTYTAERLIYGTIVEGEDVIDEVIGAVDPENQTVDINCHGGVRVVQRILLLLQKNGVEITTWQKLRSADSIAAEVDLILPQARTRLAVCAIAAQHPGGLTEWCEAMVGALQNGEKKPEGVKREIGVRLGTFRLAQKLLHAPTVVLTGPVNVGKSTLANALTGKTQSLVADVPGVTRDWTCQLADINGLGVNLVDTAGRRESTDEIEREALVQADKVIAESDLVVVVVEPDEGLEDVIFEQLDVLPETIDYLVVVNKIDLRPDMVRESEYLYVSALQKKNLDQLREAICGQFGVGRFEPEEPLVFTERQYQLLMEASNAGSIEEMQDYFKELLGKRIE